MAQCTATNNTVMEDDINGTNSNWDADIDTRQEDGDNIQQSSSSQKPNEINWLTDDLIKTLGQHAPFKGEGFSANEQLDEGELVAVFAAVFMEDSRWTNMYQLHQAVNYSGWKIICACCQTHRLTKTKLGESTNFGFVIPKEALHG